jgi:ATP-binding cassette subfamily C protein LapB
MNEILRRLKAHPKATAQLLAETLGVNILGLAQPAFVMLILGVYINSGFDQTLITLSLGMLLALVLQLVIRGARSLTAAGICEEHDRKLWNDMFEAVINARTMALERVRPQVKSDLASRVQTMQEAYGAANIVTVLDAPLALLFIGATFWLSPLLGVIGIFGIILSLILGLYFVKSMRDKSESFRKISAVRQSLVDSASLGTDAVRMFGGEKLIGGVWREISGKLEKLRYGLAGIREKNTSTNMMVMILVRVAIYAFGAMEVVAGDLSLAGLIVANVLVSRAQRQAGGMVTAAERFDRAAEASVELQDMLDVAREQEGGVALKEFKGGLVLKDLGFAWPGSTGPLFESLNLEIRPGMLVLVHGGNGSGKTTLARILAGLLDPLRGELLADGINLRQVSREWWRRQLFYIPQEPAFLNASIRENILAANRDLNEDRLEAIVRRAGLHRFLEAFDKGLETEITSAAANLPIGFKKRLALARAMAVNGRLALLDEPLEGLDSDGVRTMTQVIGELAKTGSTVIAFSHDVNIMKAAQVKINLDKKPIPGVSRRRSEKSGKAEGPDLAGEHGGRKIQ